MSRKFIDLYEMNGLRAEATRGTWAEVSVHHAGRYAEIHATDINRTVAMWLDSSDAQLVVSLVNAWPQIEAELRQLRAIAEAAKRLREADRTSPVDHVERMSRELVLDVELAGLRSLQPKTEK